MTTNWRSVTEYTNHNTTFGILQYYITLKFTTKEM